MARALTAFDETWTKLMHILLRRSLVGRYTGKNILSKMSLLKSINNQITCGNSLEISQRILSKQLLVLIHA